MRNILSAIKDIIFQFNWKFAGKIFEDVKRSGGKVVMKNNVAECVLLSPDTYVCLMDEVNNAHLIAVAAKRMAHYDPCALIPAKQVYDELGITEKDLNDCGEVEIE